MKYVSFKNHLEAQVGGAFYHFNAGSYNVEDELADLLVANYGDRGVSLGTLPSDSEQAEPEPSSREPTPAETETADAADDAAEERSEDRADDRSRRGKRTR